MRRTMLILALLAGSAAVAGPTPAPDILYLGKVQGQEAQGLIRFEGRDQAVAEGDEIPGVGTVDKVMDDVLIVVRRLSEEEKQRVRSEGGAVHDVEERHIVNVSRFFDMTRYPPASVR